MARLPYNGGGRGGGRRLRRLISRGFGRPGQLDRQRQLDERRDRIASDTERSQVRLREVEDANDVRRQREDDVGLLGLFLRMCEEPADDRQIAQAGIPSSVRRSSSRIRPASMFVSPSRKRMTVLISRLPKVGSPPNPESRRFTEPARAA